MPMSMPMGNDEPKFWSNVLQWPTTIAGQGPNGKSPSSKGSSGNSSSDDHFALRNFSWRKIFWSDALQWPVYGPISLQGMAKTRKIPSFKESSGNFIWIDLVALGNSQRQVFVFSRGCVDGEDPEATGRLDFGGKKNRCDSSRQIIFINMMISTIVLMLYAIDAMIEAWHVWKCRVWWTARLTNTLSPHILATIVRHVYFTFSVFPSHTYADKWISN